MQAIERLADKRRNWVEANRQNDFDEGILNLLTDLYPDNAHFIYELLQNAEDAHAQEVRFTLRSDAIEFQHDGAKPFSMNDVDAITSIGKSPKRDDTTNIGKFGVGFKAVFAYTETPEIQSGNIHFRINDIVVPEPIASSYSSDSFCKYTRFTLPFNNPGKSPERALSEIEKLLKRLDATSILFLTHIRKIEYLLPDSSCGYIERHEIDHNRIEIRVQQPCDHSPSSTFFLKYDKEIIVDDEEADTKIRKQKRCRIAIAYALSRKEGKGSASASAKLTHNSSSAAFVWKIEPIDSGRVCVYFPADKETSNLRFHIHAPFASTVARDSIRDAMETRHCATISPTCWPNPCTPFEIRDY